MNRPRLSVLVPTYNREKYLEQCVRSVLDQDFKDLEVIISDNASTDNTWDIAQALAKEDKRVKVYQNENNIGPVGNWKRCLDESKGSFIHWLWSDDWVEPGIYSHVFTSMDKSRSKAATFWNYRFNDNNSEKHISWRCSLDHLSGISAAKRILFLTKEIPLSPAAYILPSSGVKNSFYDNIPVSQDIDCVGKAIGVDSLMIIGSVVGLDKVEVIKKPYVNFRVHENLSTQYAQSGILMLHYKWSHLWYLSQYNVPLTMRELQDMIDFYKELEISSNISTIKKLSQYKSVNLPLRIYLSKIVHNKNLWESNKYQRRLLPLALKLSALGKRDEPKSDTALMSSNV